MKLSKKEKKHSAGPRPKVKPQQPDDSSTFPHDSSSTTRLSKWFLPGGEKVTKKFWNAAGFRTIAVIVVLGSVLSNIRLENRSFATFSNTGIYVYPPIKENMDDKEDSNSNKNHTSVVVTTTPTNNNTSSSSHQKPFLVLHVGIPKTASTAIQCGLSQLSGQLAALDNYYYIGVACPYNKTLYNGEVTPVKGAALIHYINNADITNMKGSLQLFQERLQHHGSLHHNVILSSEHFAKGLPRNASYDFLKTLARDFRIRIIVSYRRYYEWLPSLYFQANHDKKPPASLVQYIQHQVATTRIHPTTFARNAYLEHFDDVYIFNLHQKGDLVTNFICQALLINNNNSSSRTCQNQILAWQKRQQVENKTTEAPKAMISKTRSSYSLDYAKLIAVAPKLGHAVTRKTSSLFSNFQQLYPDWYQQFMSCLTSTQQQQLILKSLTMEQELVTTSDRHNQHLQTLLENHQRDHVESFAKTILPNATMFCEIDAKKALSDTAFVEFVFPK